MPTLPAAIGSYKILKELGRSHRSTVYLAQAGDDGLAPPVALRVFDPALLDQPEWLKQFQRQMRAAVKLKHRHIARLYDSPQDQSSMPFVAMEYMAGRTLRDKLKAGPVSPTEAIQIAREIGAALSYAHAHRVVHGAVKPENIWLDTGQEPVRPVLTDFGWGRILGADQAAYRYMAPEQRREKPTLTPATDVYALALVLFEMLAGQLPVEAELSSKTRENHRAESLPLLSQVAYKLGQFFDQVLSKATAQNPADRYQSVADFVQELEAAYTVADRAERIVHQRRAEQAIKLASSYLKRDNFNLDRALALTEEALKNSPDHQQAQQLRGEIRFKQGRFAEGLADYRQVYEREAVLSSPAGLAYLNALRQVAETLWQRHADVEAIKQYHVIKHMLAAGQTNGASVQAWQETWARLVESHHSAGLRAYALGGEAVAAGHLSKVAGAQKWMERELSALAALQASDEYDDLQEKVRFLQAKKSQPVVEVEAAITSIVEAQAEKPLPITRSRSSTAAPILKPLFILALMFLFLLSALCVAARMILNSQVSTVVLKQANTLITAPTPFAIASPTPPSTAILSTPPTAAMSWSILESVTTEAIPVAMLTPEVTPSATSTPTVTPSATATPTITPTPTPITGVVVTQGSRLNVREGPSVAYPVVNRLGNGDPVTILQRTPDGDWLEIETPDQKRGWVAADYVETSAAIQTIKVATNLKPTPEGAAGALLTLNINGGSVSGQLAPQQEQWYAFSDDNKETVIIFMFKPNLTDPPNAVQFFLYDSRQIPAWPPKDADALINVGASSHPASDRDQSDKTHELVWRGGPLVPGTRYYLRFVNRSNSSIQYCLAPRDEYRWSCR